MRICKRIKGWQWLKYRMQMYTCVWHELRAQVRLDWMRFREVLSARTWMTVTATCSRQSFSFLLLTMCTRSCIRCQQCYRVCVWVLVLHHFSVPYLTQTLRAALSLLPKMTQTLPLSWMIWSAIDPLSIRLSVGTLALAHCCKHSNFCVKLWWWKTLTHINYHTSFRWSIPSWSHIWGLL